jgi:tRNA uracil 4-sulfurtransferase
VEHDVILARYGELGLKSRSVRRRFEVQLKDNIEYAFQSEDLDVVVKRIPGRFLVHTSDLVKGQGILSRVFGLTSLSSAATTSSNKDELMDAVVQYARALRARRPEAKTFAVRSRRSGNHSFTSQEIAVEAGSRVLGDAEAGQGLKVNLDSPDMALHIDVRDNRAFLYDAVIDGPGGLPLGTAGRVVVLLKDRNSAVAAWLMMKRGCTVLPVHFEGLTGRSEAAQKWEAGLKRWFLRGGLTQLEFPDPQDYPAEMACALCVRGMLAAASRYAHRKRARTLVTGEMLQSTTVPFLGTTSEATELNVLRPLMGLLPTMVAKTATAMGIDAASDGGQEPCPLRTRKPVVMEEVRQWEAARGGLGS